ncbi:MAG TPA: protein kinase [Pyrinomonadaceae bacterium]|jgi:Tol biopolymer transport system component
MTPEKWRQVKEIFHAALAVAPGERAAFLDKACDDEEGIRREVESLLESHERTGDFIDSPAFEAAAHLLVNDTDSLRDGQVIGDYKILKRIGRGGMGEVYLAKDQKLGRSVALKVLLSTFNAFTDRLRRFETEACAASALNHPNILTIYGIGQADAKHFIATEFIEGETLRLHIPVEGMKIIEALDIAIQIASALSAAHEAGIIHRDIKPENIMLRRDGYVKVLDFGLAKLAEDWRGDDDDSPTRPLLKTDSGAVMGTVQYMSPEQARGLSLDARTDIWSFGVVLYEMISGRTPFDGETSSHTIVSILEDETPALKEARPDAPAELEWIVMKALRKDRNERYQTTKELLGELKELKHKLEFQAELERSNTPTKAGKESRDSRKEIPVKGSDASIAETVRIETARNTSSFDHLTNSVRRNWRWALLALAVPLVAFVAGLLGYRYLNARRVMSNAQKTSNTSRAQGALKSKQITSWAGLDVFPAFSPDGNSIAYSSDHNGSFEIYVKQLTPGGREIQLTSDGQQNFQPAWSPDGQRIAFHSNKRGGIWVVPYLGGAPKQLTDFGSRPAWSPDGTLIVFQSQSFMDVGVSAAGAIPPSTLWIVPVAGGTPRQLTQEGKPSGGHGSPNWSPDGKRIVFVTTELGVVKMDLWTVTVDGSDLKWLSQKLKPSGFYDPVYTPDGRYIYYTGGNGVGAAAWGILRLPVSPETGDVAGELEIVKETGATVNKYLRMSADGKRLIFSQLAMDSNLWSVNVTAGGEAKEAPVLLTQDTTYRKSYPAFSPDGKRIAYQRNTIGGGLDIWIIDADGKNATQLTTDPAGDVFPSWFPDGNRIAFLSARQGQAGLWSVDVQTGREQLLVKMNQDVGYPQLSPDGTEIAFNSRKNGTSNVWVVSLKGGEPRQLTFETGLTGFARWSPDSRYIAYEIKKGEDTQLFIMPREGGQSVQVTFDRGENFTGDWSPDGNKISFAGSRDGVWNLYWVSRDGKTQKRVTNYTSINAYVRYPSWSPAGNQIAFEFAEVKGNIWITDLE